MLSRYTSEAMAEIWSDAARYERWRDVELAVLTAQVRTRDVPVEVLAIAEAAPTPSPAAVEAAEAVVRHDLVAFIDTWTAGMDQETASYIHRNLTSSDIVDTAQACALAAATDLVLDAGHRLVVALADCALEHRSTLCVARTHGQPAAFDVVGHRFADLTFATNRAVARLSDTRTKVSVANITGPVGTGIGLPPELVRSVAESLGLGVSLTTTQVVFRDSIGAWVTDLALIGAVCEAVAIDVRLGQHDGVAELAEPHRQKQEGSSAMPHKRNPIAAENITGLARVLRGYIGPALEDLALWGHRDISHSSVERIVLPDAAALCEQVLNATAAMVQGLFVDVGAIEHNIKRAGAVLASSRAQAELQAQGLRRGDAAAAVRELVRRGELGSEHIDAAASEVLTSSALVETFDRVEHVRASNLDNQ